MADNPDKVLTLLHVQEAARQCQECALYCRRSTHTPTFAQANCLHCGCGVLHRHGEVQKRVKNIYETEVTAIRYLCVGCKRTFTHYLHGVDRNGCSVRMRVLMSLMWALGLSHRSVGRVLTALGCPVSRMSS